MTLSSSFGSPNPRRPHAYLRPPAPIYFPVEEEVPETGRHLLLRTTLFLSIRLALRGQATVTCDQFVYWDPTNPKQCLAPDLAVRLGGPDGPLDIWKTWELGAPDVAVEIVSDHDRSELECERKLQRYRRAGVAEVVRFDPENRASPIRIFDRFDGDLVERALSDPEALHCDALGFYWTWLDDPAIGLTLRAARERGGRDLLPTPEEAERAEKEAERRARENEQRAREEERQAKDDALARVRELEAELERRRSE